MDIQKEFKCLQCGNCCKWEGAVKLTADEIVQIAKFLGLTQEEFCAKYTRLRKDRHGLALIEKADGSCIFLNDNKCVIQPVKPQQCKKFPLEWQVPDIEKLCPAFKR